LDETTLPFYAELVAARDKMRADPHYSLLPKYRLPIYKAVQEKAPDVEYKFYGWLALITAEKVLPIWEDLMPDDEEPNAAENAPIYERITTFDLPFTMLDIAEDLLLEKITAKDVAEELELFYNWTGNFGEYQEEEPVPGRAVAVVDTCYAALMAAFPIRPFEEISPRQIEEGLPDEISSDWRADVASAAVLAYSGLAYDDDVIIGADLVNNGEGAMKALMATTHPNFQPEKRREFWEWWLNEALPEAWLEANATRE
jgi:hypothetical protein